MKMNNRAGIVCRGENIKGDKGCGLIRELGFILNAVSQNDFWK